MGVMQIEELGKNDLGNSLYFVWTTIQLGFGEPFLQWEVLLASSHEEMGLQHPMGLRSAGAGCLLLQGAPKNSWHPNPDCQVTNKVIFRLTLKEGKAVWGQVPALEHKTTW